MVRLSSAVYKKDQPQWLIFTHEVWAHLLVFLSVWAWNDSVYLYLFPEREDSCCQASATDGSHVGFLIHKPSPHLLQSNPEMVEAWFVRPCPLDVVYWSMFHNSLDKALSAHFCSYPIAVLNGVCWHVHFPDNTVFSPNFVTRSQYLTWSDWWPAVFSTNLKHFTKPVIEVHKLILNCVKLWFLYCCNLLISFLNCVIRQETICMHSKHQWTKVVALWNTGGNLTGQEKREQYKMSVFYFCQVRVPKFLCAQHLILIKKHYFSTLKYL